MVFLPTLLNNLSTQAHPQKLLLKSKELGNDGHMKQATLCYPMTETSILLGKKKSRFGAGKWNGFGGKIEEGETPKCAAVRELQEECGIKTNEDALQKIGVLLFHFNNVPTFLVHAYTTTNWIGEAEETDEMAPQWHNLSTIPYKEMWKADRIWLEEALRGKKVAANIHFLTKGVPGKDPEEFDRIEYDETLWSEE
jgi:8-oxo-dGTP pyrophosphatase MutT (NUDIX family)